MMSFAILRTLAASASLIMVVPLVSSQTLDQVIERYEAFDRAGDPELAAQLQSFAAGDARCEVFQADVSEA